MKERMNLELVRHMLSLSFPLHFIWSVKAEQSRIMPHVFVSQDTVIYERLADSSRYKDITLKHLEQFATEGERQTRLLSICFLSSVRP